MNSKGHQPSNGTGLSRFRTRRRRWHAGWVRICEKEFRALAAEALRQDPHLYPRLRHALVDSAMRCGVPRKTRGRYLRWLRESAEAPESPRPEREEPRVPVNGEIIPVLIEQAAA